MSRLELQGRWRAALPVGLALFSASLTHSQAQDATATTSVGNTQQTAYRSSIAQETVRKQADKIQAEMTQLVSELKLNGLESGNLNLLSSASTHLSSMSQEEMQQVINALQSASIAGDDSKRQQSMVSAYQGQQDIILQLKRLSSSLTSQQTGDQLMNQISALIARQSANIRQTSALLAGDHTGANLDDKEKALHTVALTEQTAIAGQIDLLFSSLGSATSQTPATPDASFDTSKAVLDAMNGTLLKDTSKLAVQLTDAGPFPSAVDKQTAVKQYLIGILKAATSKADANTKLAQAKNQLDQIKADQTDLNDATKNSKVDAATLAQRQAAINDRAEVAKALLTPLNPDAAKQVAAAQKSMQQSADALDKAQQNPKQDPAAQQKQDDAAKQDAATKQDDAQKALADASKMLDQQVADVQKQQAQSPTEQMAQLQKVQDEIKQAQTAQQVSPQQAADAAQQAQKDALAQAPEAADKLAEAANQLQQQAQNQQNQPPGQPPQNPQAAPQPNAEAAVQALAQAAQAIQDKKDALAQAAQNYQALAQTALALDQAAKDTADADKSLQNGTSKDLSDPAHKLSSAQNQVAQASQTPPGQDPSQQGLPQAAKDALAKAADALKNGSIEAVQSDRKGADEQAQKALDALKQAQSSVGQAMADVQAQAQQMQGPSEGKPGQSQMANGKGDMKNGQMDPQYSKDLITGSYGAKTTNGSALVVGGLSPKDRDAITQYQAEKTPPEYAPLVQQYLKNLSEASESH